MLSRATRDLIKSRLSREVGRIDKLAPWRVALAYPSPYSVGMSSLGFQQIYRLLQGLPGVACERVFLPDGADHAGSGALEAPVSYEGLRPLGEFPLIAFSVAYELELAGLLSRKAEVIASVDAGRGQFGFDTSLGRFSTGVSTVQLNYAITEKFGVYGQHALYYYELPDGASPVAPVARLGRQTVSVGITAWLPVFIRERAPRDTR